MNGEMDHKLILIIATLVLFGIVMVYSATSIMCSKNKNIADSSYYLKKQLIRVAIGTVALVVASRIDYRIWGRFSWTILLISVALLIATSVVGVMVKGANRWLDLGAATLQPSEMAKLGVIIFLAEYLARNRQQLGRFFKGLLPAVIPVGIVAIFIATQPNFGMAISLSVVALVMLFVAGVRVKHLLYLALPTIPVLCIGIATSSHARQRIMTFLYGGDPLGDAFQINQSLIAIGAGGLTGKGIGQGMQKLFYIPEIHTDFVFAVVGEELGFLGATVLLVLFLVFTWRGLKVAMRAPDSFGQNLAIGITAMIFIYATLNVGVVLKLLPTTGIPLPFISYGGSALLVTMISCGILLNISSHVRVPLEEPIPEREAPAITISSNRQGVSPCIYPERDTITISSNRQDVSPCIYPERNTLDTTILAEEVDACSYGRRRDRRTSDTGTQYRPRVVSSGGR